MTFTEDPQLKRELTRRAWKSNKVGRVGFAVAIAFVVAAPIVGLFARGLLEASWADSYEYDGRLVLFTDVVSTLLMLVLAYAVRKLTWERCNREVGMRFKQEVRIEGAYLTYSYLEKGIGTSVVMVDLSRGASSMEMDPKTGLITLRGSVRWLPAVRQESALISSFDKMEPLAGVRIPNCFSPNLYQALLTIYR